MGGDPDVTTRIAIPLTLISGGIDMHDDIIDLSKTKNGKATVYGKYGKDIALLAGDALLFKGLTLLGEFAASGSVPCEEMKIIVKTVKNMFFELGDAESLELQFKGNQNILPDDYLEIVRKKAADVEAHTRIGALLGGASPEAIDAIGEYGRLLGMLIILRDDWMDLFDPFEMRNRIRNEALPLPLLLSLRHPKAGHVVRETLSKKRITSKDIKAVTEAIDRSDLPQKYMKMMSKLAEDAMEQLKKHKLERRTLNLIISSTLMS
jgi:geranylgeranyl pyrophosphate synthase